MGKIFKYLAFIVCIIGFSLLSFAIGFYYGDDLVYESFEDVTPKIENINSTNISSSSTINISLEQVITECKYSNVRSSSFCLNKYVKRNYNYIYDGYSTNLTKIFTEGGNCHSYTIFYHHILRSYGFSFERVSVPGHIFGVAYDNETYCLLDQIHVYCW